MIPAALSLPEILSCVFNLLGQDRKTLRSAACVNRIWFHEATRLLWAKSDLKALMAIEPSSRRTIYASKICHFTIHFGFDHVDTDLDLDFQLLRVLHFTDFTLPQDINLRPYIQPTLEKLHLRDWPPITFLDGLNKYCPRLREFTQMSPKSNRPGLVEFFAMNKTLRRVQLMLAPLDEHEIFAATAALSNITSLEDLTIYGEISLNTMVQLQEWQFESVRNLRIHVGVPALRMLPTMFGAMIRLSLELSIDSDVHSLDALVGLPLEFLQLHVAVGIRLSPQELLVLPKNLKSLMISPSPIKQRERMPKWEISNDQFKQIFANLSKLESLLIWFALDIPSPASALEDLGRSCSKLENIRLYCPIDITAWWDIPKPLFPRLKFAWVSSVSDRNLLGEVNETTAQLMAEILDRHAPNLDRFVALDSYTFRPSVGDQLSQLTMRAHGRIKETGQTKHAKEESRSLTI
ncbi:hypothetical protein KCU95_g4215, partial [Aureobasidium melanogenum]